MLLCILEKSASCGTDLTMNAFREFCEVREYEWVERELLPEILRDAEAVVCNKTVFDEALLQKLPRLRYIGVCATGYNVIDLNACRKRGITVTNIPRYSTDAVAQMTFAFLLQFASNLCAYVDSVRAGDWQKAPIFTYYPFPLTEVKGKTLGLFGFGAIGQKVARLADAFGMKVIYHARAKKDAPYEFVSAQELFFRSDFLSFHCPLTEETKGILNRENLSKMKPGAFVINTARGGIVNEKDLADALNAGVIAGYAADVLTDEPQKSTCPLIGAKNCFLTPHVAWAPKETRARLIGILVENLKCFLSGNPQNVVS